MDEFSPMGINNISDRWNIPSTQRKKKGMDMEKGLEKHEDLVRKLESLIESLIEIEEYHLCQQIHNMIERLKSPYKRNQL
jgi:hypothetical protein